MKKQPHILLTNDDGFWAPGLQALFREVRKVAKVTIVAPRLEQSAKGHGITTNEPIRYQEETLDGEVIGYSVLGTPADCVKIGMRNLLDEEPDMLLSGINRGRNTGMDVLYSGTVAGAMEGAMYNIPSAALSLSYNPEIPDPPFEPGAQIAVKLIPLLEELGLPHGIMLNVNFPPLPLDAIKGMKVATQSQFHFRDVFEERTDPRNKPYFWLRGERTVIEERDSVDDVAIQQGYVSVTPLSANLTAEEWLEPLEQINFDSLVKPPERD